MTFRWMSFALGLAFVINYSFPLVVVLRTESLHDEPMAVLVGNFALACVCSGANYVFVAILDIFGYNEYLCRFLQINIAGFVVAIKLSQMFVAIDQYVAIVRVFRYYELMTRWLKVAVIIPWALWILTDLIGLVDTLVGATPIAENPAFEGTGTITGCHWKKADSFTFFIYIMIMMAIASVITTSLYMYTALIAYRRMKTLPNEGLRDLNPVQRAVQQRFVANYRAFRRICWTLFGFIILDVVLPILGIVSLWQPVPPTLLVLLADFRCLGIAVEGWVYCLFHSKLCDAYRKILRCGHRAAIKRAPTVSVINVSSTPSEEPKDPEISVNRINLDMGDN